MIYKVIPNVFSLVSYQPVWHYINRTWFRVLQIPYWANWGNVCLSWFLIEPVGIFTYYHVTHGNITKSVFFSDRNATWDVSGAGHECCKCFWVRYCRLGDWVSIYHLSHNNKHTPATPRICSLVNSPGHLGDYLWAWGGITRHTCTSGVCVLRPRWLLMAGFLWLCGLSLHSGLTGTRTARTTCPGGQVASGALCATWQHATCSS